MKKELSPAFSPETLFSKSKVYINRALRSKNLDINDEFLLWSSLALELLAKSSLSSIHPALIADPTHSQSLFSACGHPISSEVRTITAKTLFDRLTHVSKLFDKRIQEFCNHFAQKRNIEIHSGESPFGGSDLEQLESKFWHAASIILSIQNKDLNDWITESESQSTKQKLINAKRAIELSVKEKIEHAKENFSNRTKGKELNKQIEKIDHYETSKKLRFYYDGEKRHGCPACATEGVLAGTQYDDELHNDIDDEYLTEYILKWYNSEEFYCPMCDLHLIGTQEIEATQLPSEFSLIEERDYDFYPDYGND
ncbi:hypothetical protein [Leptospira meyeri]|uniref:hypothetical protein n=1 Tax=Leptospira meyeri TaxID=29508 RepID=UPI00223E5895|nr:hypothetical protein [Leptospira meyeri]MCW7490858.1 hypothetical protein [Leptospira meyeri]